jgi:TolB-like protein/Tfp pilus assembly protein PilF
MPSEVKREIALEIAHVLFIDIVAYSKMATDDQRTALEELNRIVQSTDEFRKAESQNQLLKIATGDGMGLIFYHSPEDPVECALEISRAIKEQHSKLQLRMGINSGPVSGVVDVNGRTNVAGPGINMAQRVMDCADAGHILLSQRVAEDLEQFKHWRPHLYHIGQCEAKHGQKIDIVNLFTAELGNSERPQRLTRSAPKADAVAVSSPRPKSRRLLLIVAACAAVVVLGVGSFFLWQRQSPKTSALGSAVSDKSIAVLPFENLSDEKQNAFFTDGVQDEILTDLAKIADLKVISRTSVMQYKSGLARNLREIAQQLGVAHLLEGSVQRSGTKVRVNAQLIDARNDAHVWAQTYDRDLADVFAIQSEIAKAIADQLQAKLSPREKDAIEQRPTTDVTAFDLYSRGRTLLVTTAFSAQAMQNLLKAVDLFNQAVERDPSFFAAYCPLASANGQVYIAAPNEHTAARLALIEAAVQAAFRLRPDSGEAHLARAELLYFGYRDYDGALAELQIARRSLPNAPRVVEMTGYILRRRGKFDEGLRYLEHALDLDPRNFFTLQQIALTDWVLRRYAEMAAVLDRALAINPNDVNSQAIQGVLHLDWKADTRPLHQAIDRIRRENPAAIQEVADSWFTCALAERDAAAAEQALAALGESTFGIDAVQFPRSFGEGLIARMTNEETRARTAFEAARVQQEKAVKAQPEHAPALCVLAVIDAALGRKEEALRESRRAMELLPVEKDSINGRHMIEYFAVTAAWAGEKVLACEYLEKATRLSGIGLQTYGELKLLPYWDPLRGDPRFDKIVASLAPK